MKDRSISQSVSSGSSGGSSGANTSLSNLTTTSINKSLVPDTSNTYNLGGSGGVVWVGGYILTLFDSNPTRSIAVEGRALYDGANNKMFDWGGELNANSHELINVLDPTDPQSAATKNYVDTTRGVPSPLTRTTTSISYAVLAGDQYIGVLGTSGPVTLTLPTASSSGTGKQYIIKDEDGGSISNNITVQGNGSELIDGFNTMIINVQYGSITLFCTNTGWAII